VSPTSISGATSPRERAKIVYERLINFTDDAGTYK
jgi:hypothetical protein